MDNPVQQFVMAAHGDLESLKTLYAERPDLLNEAHTWRPGQTETPLEAASHTGSREIALFLLEQGAPLTIVAAAMLGDDAAFERLLADDPQRIHEQGAHNLSLSFHAAVGGNIAIMTRIYQELGAAGLAKTLVTAVTFKHEALAHWLLATGDVALSETDFRGRTALHVAVETEQDDLAEALRAASDPDQLVTCDNCGALGTAYLAEIEGNMMGAHTRIFRCKACGTELERLSVG